MSGSPWLAQVAIASLGMALAAGAALLTRRVLKRDPALAYALACALLVGALLLLPVQWAVRGAADAWGAPLRAWVTRLLERAAPSAPAAEPRDLAPIEIDERSLLVAAPRGAPLPPPRPTPLELGSELERPAQLSPEWSRSQRPRGERHETAHAEPRRVAAPTAIDETLPAVAFAFERTIDGAPAAATIAAPVVDSIAAPAPPMAAAASRALFDAAREAVAAAARRLGSARAALLLYAVGLACVVGRRVVRLARTVRLLRRAERSVPPELAALWADLARSEPAAARVRLAISAEIASPACFGWRRPTLLVPERALTQISPEALRWALRHELVHIARGDAAAASLQAVATSLFWFHPAAWWLSAEVGRLRELSCDLAVVERCGHRRSYAHALLEHAAALHGHLSAIDAGPHSAGVRCALLHWGRSPSQIERRIEMLTVDSKGPDGRWRRNGRWIACSLFALPLLTQLGAAATLLPGDEPLPSAAPIASDAPIASTAPIAPAAPAAPIAPTASKVSAAPVAPGEPIAPSAPMARVAPMPAMAPAAAAAPSEGARGGAARAARAPVAVPSSAAASRAAGVGAPAAAEPASDERRRSIRVKRPANVPAAPALAPAAMPSMPAMSGMPAMPSMPEMPTDEVLDERLSVVAQAYAEAVRAGRDAEAAQLQKKLMALVEERVATAHARAAHAGARAGGVAVAAAPCEAACEEECDAVCEESCEDACEAACEEECEEICEAACTTACAEPCDAIELESLAELGYVAQPALDSDWEIELADAMAELDDSMAELDESLAESMEELHCSLEESMADLDEALADLDSEQADRDAELAEAFAEKQATIIEAAHDLDEKTVNGLMRQAERDFAKRRADTERQLAQARRELERSRVDFTRQHELHARDAQKQAERARAELELARQREVAQARAPEHARAANAQQRAAAEYDVARARIARTGQASRGAPAPRAAASADAAMLRAQIEALAAQLQALQQQLAEIEGAADSAPAPLPEPTPAPQRNAGARRVRSMR
ncbi:MAG: hypothetical protein JNL90_01455 [Planctomycetes bacterium]|nr:hypothetical protein [Planctomycetota bacterium]